MNSKRVYFLMIGLVVLLCLATVGLTYGGNKLLGAQSKKLSEAKLGSKVVENEQVSLVAAKQDIEKYSELSQLSKQIVPSDKDQARTIREITSIAEGLGITIASIGFPTSDLGAKTTVGGDKTTKVNSSISQAKPVKDIPGVQQLDVNVVSDTNAPITYTQLNNFLQKLETNRRTSHTSSLNIQPNANNNSLLSFSLTVTVYLRP